MRGSNPFRSPRAVSSDLYNNFRDTNDSDDIHDSEESERSTDGSDEAESLDAFIDSGVDEDDSQFTADDQDENVNAPEESELSSSASSSGESFDSTNDLTEIRAAFQKLEAAFTLLQNAIERLGLLRLE
ncbi:hypothetical protein TruAng_011348 [Truncatella angustata]|nr:hypothetical protein TruAng_011348 [Truncatella angustata]